MFIKIYYGEHFKYLWFFRLVRFQCFFTFYSIHFDKDSVKKLENSIQCPNFTNYFVTKSLWNFQFL